MYSRFLLCGFGAVLLSACASTPVERKSYLESTMGQQQKSACDAGNPHQCWSLASALSNQRDATRAELVLAHGYAQQACKANLAIACMVLNDIAIKVMKHTDTPQKQQEPTRWRPVKSRGGSTEIEVFQPQ
jgi:hypothetical protein